MHFHWFTIRRSLLKLGHRIHLHHDIFESQLGVFSRWKPHSDDQFSPNKDIVLSPVVLQWLNFFRQNAADLPSGFHQRGINSYPFGREFATAWLRCLANLVGSLEDVVKGTTHAPKNTRSPVDLKKVEQARYLLAILDGILRLKLDVLFDQLSIHYLLRAKGK